MPFPIIILFVLIIVLLATNIVIVPQAAQFVVERLGVYSTTWGAGIHVKIPFIDRIAKTLLWVAGGYKITVAGSKVVGEYVKNTFCHGGTRDFDARFMERVYERPFEVVVTDLEHAPQEKSSASPVGKHLDGCRIGFDAGGSDRKVSAVVNGETVYSEEVVWFPKLNSDPNYHYEGILNAMKTAASHMPRVDAIGVSSAGVYIDNKIMVASLFIKVNDDDFEKKVKNMYI